MFATMGLLFRLILLSTVFVLSVVEAPLQAQTSDQPTGTITVEDSAEQDAAIADGEASGDALDLLGCAAGQGRNSVGLVVPGCSAAVDRVITRLLSAGTLKDSSMAKSTPKPRRLGRGLSSLIQPTEPVRVDTDQTNTKHTTSSGDPTDPASGAASGGAGAAVGESGGLVRWVAVGRIEPSPFQPRRHFDEGALAQLAASITRSGLMQPIIVRPTAAGFELVAGERRWRAAERAGLTEVPAAVRELPAEEAAE